MARNPDLVLAKKPQLTSMYMGMNTGVAQFQKVQVRQALKYAIDYEAIATNIAPNLWTVWQAFLPQGCLLYTSASITPQIQASQLYFYGLGYPFNRS